jgi:ATP-dependent RNA helicase RhlE
MSPSGEVSFRFLLLAVFGPEPPDDRGSRGEPQKESNNMQQQFFPDLGVSRPVTDVLARRGITDPFPIQAMVLADGMAGHDVLAKSRTGSGKTLVFALTIVERMKNDGPTPGAVVLVPTRELAVQVADEFADIARVKGLRVATAYGGVGIGEQARRAARAHVLVATPGRLEDLANRKLVKLDAVRILVLDEADRMLDMGFQPQVDRIVRRLPSKRQTMLFSATLDERVAGLARAYTREPRRHEVEAPRLTVDEAEHRFVSVTQHGKVQALVNLLEKESGTALVFVRTKRGADRLVTKLRTHGVEAAAMHGDMRQSARQQALNRFESGKVKTLVATDVAARGLDLEAISHVINFDPPEDHTGYVHRVGRTARAGRTGTGITFVLPDQQNEVSRVAAQLKLQNEFTAEGMTIAPPRLVYASRRGRRSMLAGRSGRRF